MRRTEMQVASIARIAGIAGIARFTLVAAAVLAPLTGCVSNPAPFRWLPTPLQAAVDVHGGWIELSAPGDALAGEFLAYDRDSVFVLSSDNRVRAVAAASVTEAQIFWYDSQWGSTTAIWGLVGALSTFSHGFALVLSMPVWVIAGSSAAASDSRAPRVQPGRGGWDGARMYARWPGGLPADVPRTLPFKGSTR